MHLLHTISQLVHSPFSEQAAFKVGHWSQFLRMEYQKHSAVKRRLSERRGPLKILFGYRWAAFGVNNKQKKGQIFFFPTEEAMINKRLLHFLSFVYFKRGQLKIHALNVAVRRQMLRHFYSMITPLLTLHTATTATLLVVKSTLSNTKRSLQSICNTATTKFAWTRSRTQAPHRLTSRLGPDHRGKPKSRHRWAGAVKFGGLYS